MESYRTEIHPDKADFQIDHQSSILSMGSCFANSIGNKLQDHRFDISINPLGISFHPLVISQHLANCINGAELDEASLIRKGDREVSFLHHSSIGDVDGEELCKLVQDKYQSTFERLQSCDVLLITFGTAWGYRHKSLDQIVANCHKASQDHFSKELTDIQTIVWSYKVIFKRLQEQNPNLKIVMTVSPVRHWKDGAVENARSKAHLLSAVHELVDAFDHVHYFPAYELMTDDLRDYRFYKEDMLHPSDTGVNYVWKKFTESFMNDETRLINEKLVKLNKSKSHIGKEDPALTEFISKMELEIDQLMS